MMETDDFENGHDRDAMQENEPGACEVTEGIFSSNKCEPKKKEVAKCDEKKKKKKKDCGCKSKQKKLRPAVNPFIVFYVKYYFDHPSKRVTEVARAAAKLWCRMSAKDKECYVKIARAESVRRQKSKGKCRKRC